MIKKFKDFVLEGKYEEDHELNRILDKISNTGIESITADEKAYLDGDVKEEPTYNGTYTGREMIGANGEYLDAKKDDFVFRVYTIDADMYSTSTKIGVAVFDKNDKYMVDEHVVDELFPELKKLGMDDLAEGEIEYYGSLTQADLVARLNTMGYKAIASTHTGDQ